MLDRESNMHNVTHHKLKVVSYGQKAKDFNLGNEEVNMVMETFRMTPIIILESYYLY